MSAKTFKLIHYFDSGFYDNRKIYEFDSSEKLEKFYEQFYIKYRKFTDRLIYDKDDELVRVYIATDGSKHHEFKYGI